MRKFLVVLLILSVMGGAFAQEERGTWSNEALTGEIELGTTIDFIPLDQAAQLPVGDGETYVGVKGGLNDAFLKVTFNYEKGDWAVKFPLKVTGSSFGTDDAKVTYTNGAVKVVVPFEFKFQTDTNGALPIAWTGGDKIEASFDNGDNQKFNIKFPGLGGGEVTHVGGWYKFSNDSELAISYREGMGSAWWRASEIVLEEVEEVWENIGKGSGIAYRFIFGDVQAGISFAGKYGSTIAGDAILGEGDYSYKDYNNFSYDFLMNPTIGFRFSSVFDISAMVGLRYNRHNESFYIPIHAGFKTTFGVGAGLHLAADTSMKIGGTFSGGAASPTTMVNLGASLIYGDVGSNEGFWVGFGAKGLDLVNDDRELSLLLKAGFNVSIKDKDFWKIDTGADNYFGYLNRDSKKENDVYAGLGFGTGNLLSGTRIDFGLVAVVGYNALPITEYLTFSADAGVLFSISVIKDQDAENLFEFYVEPSLKWMVIDTHSYINFAYHIGACASNGEFGINKHDITISYKWIF